jgi:4-alpha-glucanotransferase
VIWETASHLDQKIKSFLQQTANNRYRFRDEYDTQRKLENHFSSQDETPAMLELKQALFDLHANIIFWDDDYQKDAYHFRFNIAQTISFQHLTAHEKYHLLELYNDYFFSRQDETWRLEALDKLPALKRCTEMLICGEDLGLVPRTVPEVMANLGFLSMEVQRMPKKLNQAFFDPYTAPFLAVVTPSTHDMSTIREWWLEDKQQSQRFYNELLWQHGEAPLDASCHIVRAIVLQHLGSPAMWSVFQLQDLFALREELRLEDPYAERINIPGNPKHFWRFRMHIPLEELIKKDIFNTELKTYINSCGR